VRIAFLADVHGNAIALERSLATIDAMRIDGIHVIGDLVGYMPGEQECLRMLEGNGVAFQQGNHEHMLLAPTAEATARDDIYRLTAVRARMSAATMDAIAAWPIRRELTFAGRRVLLVHGSPDDPLHGYVYPDSDVSALRTAPYDAVVMAHTHRPFVRHAGDVLIANVGSVGLPRDVGSLSSLAVYDSDAHDLRIFRVALDVDAVLARWGGAMHAATKACLKRTAADFVGEVVA
jgi:predicted phosphodiesterase